MPTLSIEDYGIIGNYASCALINRLGGIDWCCLPFLDSPSHFSAILDQGAGGKFQLCPQGDFRSEQRYLQRSLVLETYFETPFGRAVLTDWMPLHGAISSEPLIYRRIDVTDGKIGWSLTCDPRFDYGETPTDVEFHGALERGNPGTQASEIWSRRHLLFRGQAPGQIAQLFSSLDLPYSTFYSGKEIAEAKFTLSAGQSALFAWAWGRRMDAPSTPPVSCLKDTVDTWRNLAHRCMTSGCLFAGPWHDASVKTGLFLRLLVAPYSGAVAEAVTSSLGPASKPRDCRYAWLRNSALTLQALSALGMKSEARNYFGWLSEIVIRDGVELLQPVYTLDGGKVSPERELKNLKGYRGSFPVHTGTDASSRFHLDLYGHILLAADLYQREWGDLPAGLWPRMQEIADFICGAWRRPDQGPWDNHDKPEHYVVSKALCWAALDRAGAIAGRLGERANARWSEEARILHRTVCEQGFDSTLNSFVRSFGNTEIDPSILLLPLCGFLPPDDPRIRGSIDAIMSRLSEGVLVRRQPGEAPDLWSSFLLVANLALSGQVDDASDRMAELCSFATHLGFFGEQVDSASQETFGNIPNASAHLALVNAALYIGAARSRTLPVHSILGRPESPEAKPGEAAARNIA